MMNASPAPQEIFLLKLGEVVLKVCLFYRNMDCNS